MRHLLIDEFGGHEHTDLILVTAATEEKIFSGTLYESVQKAHEMGQSWAKGEGLESAREDQPPYEPLAHAGKLVMLLDHDAISDPTWVQTDPRKPSFNATGLVQLKNWRGIRAQNGGTYKYAVTSGSIIAEPQLPKGYPELTSGSSPDLAQQRLRAVETKKSGGLRVECHFAGMTLVPSAPSTINSQLDQLQASSRRLPQISVHFLQPLPRNL